MADLEMQAGVRIRVKFDNGFYAGSVAKWDPQKGRALVEFDDGDVQTLVLGPPSTCDKVWRVS
jgi:hypothetical protein